MATVDFSAIQAALATLFQDKVASQINRAVVLSQVLPFQAAQGKNLSWDANVGDVSAADATLNDGTDVSTFNDDTLLQAVLQWGTYTGEAFAITGKARAAAAATGNPAELADLFAEKLERAVNRLAKRINQDLYAGSGSTNYIQGLTSTNGAIKSTGTYAGIVRGTYAQWAGNEALNGSVARPLTIQLMRDMRKAIYNASGKRPDLIVCDAAQHEAYGMLLKDQRRLVQEVTMRGQKVTLDGGYDALMFDNIPVIADVDCPSGKMLFLNTSTLKIRQLGDVSNDSVGGGMGNLSLRGTAEEQLGGGQTKLSARINPLNRAGDAFKFQLVCYPQLQCEQPNANGILGDLQ